MSRRPATRASNARDYLDFLGRTYPSILRQVRETVPREVLERMNHAVRTEWIPIASDGHFVDGVLAMMGTDGMRTSIREFTAHSLTKSPMLNSLFEGVIRVFGVSMGGFLRVLPSGLGQSYQDAFTLEIVRGDRNVLVAFDDIAPELLAFSAYPVIWEGIFLGLYDLASTPPQLDFRMLPGARRMEARFRW